MEVFLDLDVFQWVHGDHFERVVGVVKFINNNLDRQILYLSNQNHIYRN